MTVDDVKTVRAKVRSEIEKAVVGQGETVDLLLCALMVGGHTLLEGPPGTAKTFLVRAFAKVLDRRFGRVQFTPDLMPGDILGTNLFDFQSNSFSLTKGPIFTDVLLADEINRTPPKTQAALLEAMQERAVTIDGTTYPLGEDFTVIATQNPIEQQGTYPLPEAQLDRFLFKQIVGYPPVELERAIVAGHSARAGTPDLDSLGVETVLSAEALAALRGVTASVRLTDEIIAYVVDLVRETRQSPDFETGASPRAGAALAAASRAFAALNGRDYVVPDDVKTLAGPALRHRVILSPAAEIEGRSGDEALAACVDRVVAPR